MQSKSLSNKSKISKSSCRYEGSKEVESYKNNEAPIKKSLKQSIAADSDRKPFKANNEEEQQNPVVVPNA